MRSRHSVYYFRLVLPPRIRTALGKREVRLSLRSKDKRRATFIMSLINVVKSHHLDQDFPWEREFEESKDRFMRGLQLIEQCGRLDPDDAFARDELLEQLSGQEFDDYSYAWEHQEKARAARKAKRQLLEREALATLVRARRERDEPEHCENHDDTCADPPSRPRWAASSRTRRPSPTPRPPTNTSPSA
jgi:hypothetical protein